MTPYAPPPTGSTAADLLAWWRQRAHTDRVATGYYAACDAALAELGSEAQLRGISALTLDAGDLARRAADGCWFRLSEASRHHQTLRLRRALYLFGAALAVHGSSPASAFRLGARPATSLSDPIAINHAGGDWADVSPKLMVYLVSDRSVLSAATAVLDAAGLVVALESPENRAALNAAISVLEKALAEAGVAAERIPATAAALTAYIYRDAPRR